MEASAGASAAPTELAACRQSLLKLYELLDGRLDVVYKLARVEARLGLADSALRRLEIYARSGLDLGDPSKDPAFAALGNRASMRRIAELYGAGQTPKTTHTRIATLSDSDLVAEDLVCEERNDSFLVSSVRKRKIVRVAGAGQPQDFVTESRVPMWGVFALGLDLPRRALWATTFASNFSPPLAAEDKDRSAVLELDSQSGGLIARYELPRGLPHAFGDLTVTQAGLVYIADGVGGGVYKVAHASAELEALVEPGALSSPQTPAISTDGTRLLVPDYTRGIAILELRRNSLTWLAHPPELALFGIDGMYLQGRTLVAIQNGTAPERVIAAQLSEHADRIERWQVLVAGAPGLGDPTHGCLRGRDFYFIANSGWDRFSDDGEPKPDAAASPAEIWKVRLPPY